MLKRLFDRQLLRISPAERLPSSSAAAGEAEDSVCLDGMVRSFLEDGGGVAAPADKPGGNGGRYCNCFHGASDDSDDEEAAAASSDVDETIKVGSSGFCLLCSYPSLSRTNKS
jgi:hypothetical protein